MTDVETQITQAMQELKAVNKTKNKTFLIITLFLSKTKAQK